MCNAHCALCKHQWAASIRHRLHMYVLLIGQYNGLKSFFWFVWLSLNDDMAVCVGVIRTNMGLFLPGSCFPPLSLIYNSYILV